MNSENFCYWLQGFFELKKTIDHCEGATAETLQVIEDHLKLVFDKVTPDRLELTPQYIQRDPLGHQKLIDALRPKPVDLIGKKFDDAYWKLNPLQITC